MKRNYTEFECDNEACIKSINIEGRSGYPYSEGWIYLYKFDGKINKTVTMSNDDKHFCSASCMKNYLIKEIDSAVHTGTLCGGR